MRGLDEDIPRDEQLRARGICRQLLGPGPADSFVVQIERVLWRLIREQNPATIAMPHDVVAAYRTKGLIPPCLIACLQSSSCPEALAVCFSACIYPTRASTLLDQLEHRLSCFLTAYQASQPTVQGLRDRQLKGVSEEEINRLLNDLAAVEYVRAADQRIRDQLVAERRDGAALYLATQPEEQARKILANWRDDAGLVGYIRRFLPTCPSNESGEAARGGEAWGRVSERLAEQAPAAAAEDRERAIAMERHLRRRARNRAAPPPGVDEGMDQVVSRCWEQHWDRLTCGFPYYAFRSHYAWWWRQSVGWWLNRKIPVPDPGKPPSTTRALTREELLFFWEGYRLVRTTFFARDGTDTPRLRQALDDLWQLRLEKKLTDDAGAATVKGIAAENHNLTDTRINMLSYKLRLRIWAYTLSRGRGLSNAQIISARLPTHEGASDCPLAEPANRSVACVVASLARIAPKEYSLVWAFTAHRILRPRVDPQHPDPWEFREYLIELWRWAMAGSLSQAAAAARDRWDLIDVDAAAAIELEPFRSLLRELMLRKAPADVEEYLRGPGAAQVARAEAAAREHCTRILGDGGMSAATPSAMAEWRKIAPGHWVVPVWFLTFAARLDARQLMSRLAVDEDEREQVTALMRAMCQRERRN